MSVIGGRYFLDREIGRGSSGAVWRARDSQLGRNVAVKLLRPEIAEDVAGRRRFEREARTVAQLRSPHIVQIHDAGLHESAPFIVMELLHGESLQMRLERQSRVSLPFAVRVVTQVAQALALTHRAGIVHRDIKPANIFLARDGDREIAKLLDFGVATLTHRSGPRDTSNVIGSTGAAGTPQYMSPEQIANVEVDHRADLWALSVLVHQMLTGRFPFACDTLVGLATNIRTGKRVQASSLVSHVDPTRIDKFFERAFAVGPEERHQNAGELAADLVALAEASGERALDTVKRVLFVDDEEDMKLLIQHRFRRQISEGKFEVFYALDGQAGLDVLRAHPEIDVVVTDLNMPRMDGLTFLRRIPEVDPLLRVVVVSAYSDMDNIRAAMNLGAFDFLGKPIDFDDLECTVLKCAGEVARQRRSSRAHEENGILRALTGGRSTERIISSLRATTSGMPESFEGSVAFVRIHRFDELLARDSSEAFDVLNECLLLFGTEVLARGGTIDRFAGASLLAVFRGEAHLTRAAETCLAIRDRLRIRDAETPGRTHTGAALGLGHGTLWQGCCGSIDLGRVEHTVFGPCIASATECGAIADKNEILVSSTAQVCLERDFVLEGGEDAASASSVRARGALRLVRRDPAAASLTDHAPREQTVTQRITS
jgi:CheY-like chemotaxis protein